MGPHCNHNKHPSRWFLGFTNPRVLSSSQQLAFPLGRGCQSIQNMLPRTIPGKVTCLWSVSEWPLSSEAAGSWNPRPSCREVQTTCLISSTSWSAWTQFKYVARSGPRTQVPLLGQEALQQGQCVPSALPWVECKNTAEEFLFTPPSFSGFPSVSGICSPCLWHLLCEWFAFLGNSWSRKLRPPH